MAQTVAAKPHIRFRRVRVFGICLVITLFEASQKYNNSGNYYLFIFVSDYERPD